MIILSINLLILSACLLIVGLIKPNWILFWMEKPGRLPIIALSSALFMGGVVMFSQANLENQNEKKAITDTNKEVSDIPKPTTVEPKSK